MSWLWTGEMAATEISQPKNLKPNIPRIITSESFGPDYFMLTFKDTTALFQI